MRGDEFVELTAFVAIADARGFRGAARRLGVSPSALSRSLNRLEQRLGLRLFNRTTRSVGLTEAGELLYAKLVPSLAGLAKAVDDVVALKDEPGGAVRLNLPRMAAELILAPRIARFCSLYPRIRLNLVIDDELTDVVGEGFDAGIRIGERLASDMIAVRLSPPYCNAVVGSPAYFALRPLPETPHDLRNHSCLNYRWASSGRLYRWQFNEPERSFEMDVDGPLVVNDIDTLRNAAIDGVGLACLPEAFLAPHIASGELIRVLEGWCYPYPGFYLYHPSRHQTPPGLRALISFLQDDVAI